MTSAVPAICRLAVVVAKVTLPITLVRRNFDLGVAGALGAVGARRRKSLNHSCAIASNFLGQPSAAQRLPTAFRSFERLARIGAFELDAGRHRVPQSTSLRRKTSCGVKTCAARRRKHAGRSGAVGDALQPLLYS